MSAPYASPRGRRQRGGQPAWLPPNGIGNGLDDEAWAPILDADGELMPPLLRALRRDGVAGFAAPAPAPLARLPGRQSDPRRWRLWVGVSGYATAEDTARRVLGRRAT